MVLKTDHKGPLSLYCSSEPHPRHGVLCRTKENREEKKESGRLGKIPANLTKKASLCLEETNKVNPLPLRQNELGYICIGN